MKGRTIARGAGAALVVAAAIGLVACAPDDADDGAGIAATGRITRMEASGEMHDMAERHRQMLERMQQDASPAMLELMNNDPMWQMMRSGEWARLDEQHQEDIDRMLGRGQP